MLSDFGTPLYQRFPPSLDDGSNEGFSGRFIYQVYEPESPDSDEVNFMCGYETREGFFNDSHSDATVAMLEAIFADRPEVLFPEIAESVHTMNVRPGETATEVTAHLVQTLEAAGAVEFVYPGQG